MHTVVVTRCCFFESGGSHAQPFPSAFLAHPHLVGRVGNFFTLSQNLSCWYYLDLLLKSVLLNISNSLWVLPPGATQGKIWPSAKGGAIKHLMMVLSLWFSITNISRFLTCISNGMVSSSLTILYLRSRAYEWALAGLLYNLKCGGQNRAQYPGEVTDSESPRFYLLQAKLYHVIDPRNLSDFLASAAA